MSNNDERYNGYANRETWTVALWTELGRVFLEDLDELS